MIPQITRSRAVERAACMVVLRKVEIGATITYEQIKAESQLDPIANRHVLASARNELRDEDGILFEPVTGVGLRRMTMSEVATIAPGRRRRKAHRQAKLGLRELATIADPDQLSPGEKLQYLASSSVLGAIAAIGTHKGMALVERVVTQSQTILPVSETLLALKDIR